ncbi:MAG: hypothetical protein JO069_16045 [Verrucomicrobia bacterium]|nr:hypothetical protein [Verrucomicrobiota bacterium]
MISLHRSHRDKPDGPLLGSLLLLSSAAALAFYLTRQKAAKRGAERELKKTTLINGRSLEELVAFASDLDNLGHILARVEHYRSEPDGSFAVRFSAFGQSTDQIFGRVIAQPPDSVRYTFSTGIASEPVGEVQLQFKPGSHGVMVTGDLSSKASTALPGPVTKLIEKGWLAFTLRQLKMLVEAGEIATTKGQPSGREAKQ